MGRIFVSQFQKILGIVALSTLFAGIFPFPASRAVSGREAYAEAVARSDSRKAHLAAVISDLAALAGAYKKNTWKTIFKETEADYETVRADFDAIRAELVARGASEKILTRLDAQKTAYENTAGKIIADAKAGKDVRPAIAAFIKKPSILDEVLNPTPFRATVLPGTLHTAPESSFPGVLDLSSRALRDALQSGKVRLEKRPSSDVNAESTSSASTTTESAQIQSGTQAVDSGAQISSIYTDETEEAPFTQAIRDLAAELNHDPLAILNYVAANIRYVPYYGVKKGADATLAEKEGNDLDQISLLAALLRVGDQNGNYKTQVRYRQGFIKLELGRVMDMLGVEDPIVAAKVFEKTGVPYVLYVDQNQNPLFFMLEHFWAEAYVNYDYSRGVLRGGTGEERWIPMDPTLGRSYFSQPLDAVGAMNFNVGAFYDLYLSGTYGTSTPLGALKQNISVYLAANEPTRTYDDVRAKEYRDVRPFEFIPLTLPYEIVSAFPEFAAVPENLKHRIEFKIMDDAKAQTFLTYAPNVAAITDRELALDYVAATPDDQAVIDSYPSIYDVVPLSLVHVKPVVKVRGAVTGGGGTTDPEVALGVTQRLVMSFKAPSREIGSAIIEKTINTQEKTLTAGGAEGIAINTDHIALPETRPAQDTSSTNFAASQKLYATALHFLYRLQASHDELAEVMGGRFTNSATRAVVFNGIDITYSGGEPYSFTWKGLRIDASSLISYWSHFGTNVNRHQKEFLEIFGLQASLDEAAIFEDDYGIEAMSTVKGLRLINQGAIPGISVKKITQANISQIDTLNISSTTKTKLKDAVRLGRIVYVSTSQFTYQNWTGLVYIDLDPQTGAGGYIIGEGLNGGYTVEQWPSGWENFWRTYLAPGLTATILSPAQGAQFTMGDSIPWRVRYDYTAPIFGAQSWIESGQFSTTLLAVGTTTLWSGYGTGASVEIQVVQTMLGRQLNQFDDLIILNGQNYGIPADFIKSVIYQEALIGQDEIAGQQIFITTSYRYEAHKDYDWYSGPLSGNRILEHPYHHFTIGGTDTRGRTIPQGDQLNQLVPGYRSITTERSYIPLDLTDTDNDGNLTVAELVARNPRQGWPPRPDWNFTSQLVISASYGLGQVLYETALDRGFDTRLENNQSARSIYDLFKADVAIDLSAKHLKFCYDSNGQNWNNALVCYNGRQSYADAVLATWKNGNGIFKPILVSQ